MSQESGRTCNQTILSAWQDGLKATGDATLKQQCLQQEPDLLPRFIEHYQQLKALPRRMRRGLQRQWKRSLAGVALLIALGQAPALAATLNVSGTCTLVRAIHAANSDTTVGGNCTQGSGADTIVLPANSTQTLTTVNYTAYGPTGLPAIRSIITIAGNNSTIRRAASAPEFRIFTVGQNGNLTLRQTQVTGGSLAGESRGGGLYRRSGTLTLIGCTISGNSAYLGGGVANSSLAGTLTITNSTVSGNTASGNLGGGGLFNNTNGTLTVTNSTISGNTAKFGGGLRNDGSATLTNSTLSGNAVSSRFRGNGGGAANVRGSLTLTNSTVSDNSASHSSGGVDNYQGTVTLTNSTISGNTAKDGGGASNAVLGLIPPDGAVGFSKMVFVNSSVSGNTAASKGGGVYSSGLLTGGLRSDVVLNRTLISGNTAPNGAEVYQLSGGVVTANNFNLFGHSGLTTAQALGGSGVILFGASDITATADGTDPTALAAILNTSLANNGGPTRNHALPSISPAVDAVTNVSTCPPPAQDQRGVLRSLDGNSDGGAACDIGAFELKPRVFLPPTPPVAPPIAPPRLGGPPAPSLGPPGPPGPPPPPEQPPTE
jgi:hypothetical protein